MFGGCLVDSSALSLARKRETERQTDRQTDRQAGRQADRQTDRQTDRQADRQAGRQRHRRGQKGVVHVKRETDEEGERLRGSGDTIVVRNYYHRKYLFRFSLTSNHFHIHAHTHTFLFIFILFFFSFLFYNTKNKSRDSFKARQVFICTFKALSSLVSTFLLVTNTVLLLVTDSFNTTVLSWHSYRNRIVTCCIGFCVLYPMLPTLKKKRLYLNVSGLRFWLHSSLELQSMIKTPPNTA